MLCMEYMKHLCACGCGTEIDMYDNRGRFRVYFKGHHFKGKNLSDEHRKKLSDAWLNGRVLPSGENHWNWNGGRYLEGEYWHILKPNHHRADKGGYVPEHIVIYEEHYQCCMLKWGDVHHKDNNTQNNTWYNLQGMMHGHHTKLTRTGHKESEESRKNNSIRNTGSGNPNYGKTHIAWTPKDAKTGKFVKKW